MEPGLEKGERGRAPNQSDESDWGEDDRPSPHDDPKRGRRQILRFAKKCENRLVERIRLVGARFVHWKGVSGRRFGEGGNCWVEWSPFSKEWMGEFDHSKNYEASTSDPIVL